MLYISRVSAFGYVCCGRTLRPACQTRLKSVYASSAYGEIELELPFFLFIMIIYLM